MLKFLKKKIDIHRLSEIILQVLDARDPYTFLHSLRVAKISELLAEKLLLSECEIEKIHIAAHLHDIGKIGIPDYVLNKKGILTDYEYNLMKAHPRIGYNILKNIPSLKNISEIVLFHHERYDGKGYPCGKKKDEVPIGSYIIAVADSFDAMTSDRSYRKKVKFNLALNEIIKCSNTQFFPKIVTAFTEIKNKIFFELEKIDKRKTLHSVFDGHEYLIKTR